MTDSIVAYPLQCKIMLMVVYTKGAGLHHAFSADNILKTSQQVIVKSKKQILGESSHLI